MTSQEIWDFISQNQDYTIGELAATLNVPSNIMTLLAADHALGNRRAFDERVRKNWADKELSKNSLHIVRDEKEKPKDIEIHDDAGSNGISDLM
jgi:hypothetical protein